MAPVRCLAFAFLERYPDLGFHARWIKPAAGFTGNHIYVTNGINAFDYHGLTTEQRLLALGFKRGRRFFPGWDATLVDLPADVLVSEQRSRQIEGLWLREPKQFLHDALPRARNFLEDSAISNAGWTEVHRLKVSIHQCETASLACSAESFDSLST